MWRRNREIWAEEAEVDDIVSRWSSACEGAGLVRTVSTVSGLTVIPPKITHITLGAPRVLTVALQPGMTPDDIRNAAPRLAPHLGSYGLRVEDRAHGAYALVTLLTEDPLTRTIPVVYSPNRIHLGITEDGTDVTVPPAGHMIMQGATRSGKSCLAYAILAQAHRQGVLIAGSDISGLLLRPFDRSEHRAVGTQSLDQHEAVLHRLTVEMDRRISQIPMDRDTTSEPVILAVVEELAGLHRIADATDMKQGKRIRALIGRLLAEGAKANIACLLILQRAEAAVVGSFERSNCATRISFRTENKASVELLHPGSDPVVAENHSTAPAGVAIVSMPGRPLSRVRAPWIGGYADYVQAIRDAS